MEYLCMSHVSNNCRKYSGIYMNKNAVEKSSCIGILYPIEITKNALGKGCHEMENGCIHHLFKGCSYVQLTSSTTYS